MSELTGFLIVAAFIGGAIFGAGVLYFGYKLGFRASYEIRECKEQEGMDKGLFPPKKEPAEFDLIGDE